MIIAGGCERETHALAHTTDGRYWVTRSLTGGPTWEVRCPDPHRGGYMLVGATPYARDAIRLLRRLPRRDTYQAKK